jgi:hypothetical protein
MKAGTPNVSNLRRATVTERVQLVQVGDRLTVILIGARYEVRDGKGPMGYRSWGSLRWASWTRASEDQCPMWTAGSSWSSA